MLKMHVFTIISIVALSGIFIVLTVVWKQAGSTDRKQVNSTEKPDSRNRSARDPNTEEPKVAEINETSHDPAEFAAVARRHEMIYTEAVKNFGKSDLPKMYSLLSQESHANEWRFIAQLIGFVSDRGNRNSIVALLAYLQRQDIWPDVKEEPITSYDVGMGKILCLQWIGMIGGEYAEDILLRALTLEGAEELAKEWIHFTEISYPGGREYATAHIRGRAAMGLIYCQSTKGIEIVEQMYENEKKWCIRNGATTSELFNGLIDAMAYKSYIDENGLRKAFELHGSHERLEVISEYIKRYWLQS